MRKILFLISLSAILFSCKKDPKSGKVTLRLDHTVETIPLEFDTMLYTSPTGHPYKITKLVYYISELAYIQTDGTEQVIHKGFLINPKEKTNLKIPFNDILPGKYNKIRFQFGFSKATNYIDYLPQTQENQNMYWFNAQDSLAYHYMKYEGKYDSLETGIEKNFKYHFGPTDGNDNSFTVELNVDEFEINDNSFNVYVKADLQEWLQNPTEYNFPDYSMVMMHQNVQEIYKANGKSVFSFKQLTEDAK